MRILSVNIVDDVKDWREITIHLEHEGVNKTTVKRLDYDLKRVYTFIKRNNGSVKAVELIKKFSEYDVEDLLMDLQQMYLIYFTCER